MKRFISLWLAFLALFAAFACRRDDAPARVQASTSAQSAPSTLAPSTPPVIASDAGDNPNDIPAGCEETVVETVNALPEVKRAIASATKEADRSHGAKRFGGIGPNNDGEGGLSGSMGIHTDERFEARIDYAVDKKGQLTVTALGSELKLSREALQSVAQACRH